MKARSVPFLRRTSKASGDDKDSFHSASDLTTIGRGFFEAEEEEEKKKSPARVEVPAELASIQDTDRRRPTAPEMATKVEPMSPSSLERLLQDPAKKSGTDYLIVDVRDEDFAVRLLVRCIYLMEVSRRSMGTSRGP